MRILIATDAWLPQVNGVVRTLSAVAGRLSAAGHAVRFLSPDGFRAVPCPTYPEIRLALAAPGAVARAIDGFAPDAVHIATEGPLGLAARRYCLRRRFAFTTSFHTKFPEYVHARFGVPVSWGYAALRRFHGPSAAVMVATRSLHRTLAARGFRNIVPWTRGVDTALFRPGPKAWLAGPRPIAMYVGRVAVEKNVEAFLALDLPGSKCVVGDGPQLPALKAKYPEVRFAGYRTGEELARYVAAADVFVFPSRTDTFGLVLLEALASGVPVAAYPVTGPLDVVDGSGAGVLDEDLGRAARLALAIDPAVCRAHALTFSWEASAQQFLENLRPLR